MNDRPTDHRRHLPAIAALLFLLLSSPALAQSGEWIVLDSAGLNMKYQAMQCADGEHCMATAIYTNANFVRRSTDAGKTWSNVYGDTVQNNPHHYPLRMLALAYPSPHLCLVACDSGVVLRSTDNGETWQRLYAFGRGQSKYIGGISMLDDLHGVAGTWERDTSDFGKNGIVHTTDGGASWQPMNLPPQPEAREGVGPLVYLSANTIIGIARVHTSPDRTDVPRLYAVRTTNGGASWSVYNGPTIYAGDGLNFVDSLHGFAYGTTQTDFNGHWDDHFARTTDGGMTWTNTFDSTIGYNLGIHDMAFLDTLNGVAVGPGKIIRTTDGGMTWSDEGMRFERTNHNYVTIAYPSPATILTGTNEGNVYLFVPDPSSVTAPAIPSTATLAAFPNPITTGAPVSIAVNLPRSDRGPDHPRLSLVDARGATVATIEQPITSSTPAHFTWSVPTEIPAGVYFLRLVNGATVSTLPLSVMH